MQAATRVFIFLPLFLATGCEPELGAPCSPDGKFVKASVEQRAGSNDLVQNVNFENCSQAFCLSSDGSRPYCTKRCQRDLDCNVSGFTCEQVVQFGQLACEDWSTETDCFDAEGSPSERPISYCSATPQTIQERDEQCSNVAGVSSCVGAGRLQTEIDSDWSCPDNWYGASDGCDCGCGATDPDCNGDDFDDCEYGWCPDGSVTSPDNITDCTSST